LNYIVALKIPVRQRPWQKKLVQRKRVPSIPVDLVASWQQKQRQRMLWQKKLLRQKRVPSIHVYLVGSWRQRRQQRMLWLKKLVR
jgi:hypothetical protein